MLRPIPTPEVMSKAARARSLLYVPAQNDQKAKDGAARTSGEMSGSMSSTLGVSKKPGRSELQRQNPQNQQKKTSPSSKQTASATLCCPQSAQRWPIVMLYTAQHSFVIYTDVRSLNMVGKFDRFWILRTIAGEKHLFLEYFLNPQFLGITHFDQFLFPNISHLDRQTFWVWCAPTRIVSFFCYMICFQQGSTIWQSNWQFLGWNAAKDWGRTGKEGFFTAKLPAPWLQEKEAKLCIQYSTLVTIIVVQLLVTLVRMQLALFLAYPSINAVHECISMSFVLIYI